MEEKAVRTGANIVEIRPGTAAQTDREREFVECLLQKLREYRDMGVEVDSVMMCFVGTKVDVVEGEAEADSSWLDLFRFLSDDRDVGPTLAFMSMYIQKYVSDSLWYSE